MIPLEHCNRLSGHPPRFLATASCRALWAISRRRDHIEGPNRGIHGDSKVGSPPFFCIVPGWVDLENELVLHKNNAYGYTPCTEYDWNSSSNPEPYSRKRNLVHHPCTWTKKAVCHT